MQKFANVMDHMQKLSKILIKQNRQNIHTIIQLGIP